MRSVITRVRSIRVSTVVLVLVPIVVMALVSILVVVPMVADVPHVGVVVVMTVVGVVVRVVGIVITPAAVIPVAEADSPGVIPARIIRAVMAANTKTTRTIPAGDCDARDDPQPIDTRVHRGGGYGW